MKVKYKLPGQMKFLILIKLSTIKLIVIINYPGKININKQRRCQSTDDG